MSKRLVVASLNYSSWSASLQGNGGPYLFGHFTIADCMYAPVMTRFRTYGIELDGDPASYAEAIWAEPSVQKWEQLALTAPAIPKYDALLG